MRTDRGKGSFKVPTDKAEHRLVVTYRQISKLKLNSNNPRAHSPKQIRQIARSIETFTFLVPVLVDGHGNVLAGHGRILAIQLLGWTEVPVISVDHLSENQARAFMIADNRLTENSVWDARLLGQQLKELSKLELDFSLEVTGFTMAEIDISIEGLAEQPEGDDPGDALPEMQTGPSVTQLGDQWLLGTVQFFVATRWTMLRIKICEQRGPRRRSLIAHTTSGSKAMSVVWARFGTKTS